MAYTGYLAFLTEMKQIIRDGAVEFSTEAYLALDDAKFDIKFTTFLTRLQKRCKDYSESWFFGPSRFVEQYSASLRQAVDYPRSGRFKKMQDLTDEAMRSLSQYVT